VTAFLRASGDAVSRSDRLEPDVNSFAEGDPRDTTTPAAMAASLQRVVLGEVLQPASRQQLADWLIDNETGDACLRAWASAGGWATRPAAMARTRATTSPCCGRVRAARRGC
jgi:beta-lactamase class A